MISNYLPHESSFETDNGQWISLYLPTQNKYLQICDETATIFVSRNDIQKLSDELNAIVSKLNIEKK